MVGRRSQTWKSTVANRMPSVYTILKCHDPGIQEERRLDDLTDMIFAGHHRSRPKEEVKTWHHR
jgi:hypothetical protein